MAFRPQLNDAEELVWAVLRAAQTTQRRGISRRRSQDGRAQLAAEIDYVLLAGGMSRVPAVAERLRRMFPPADVYLEAGVDPQEVIAAGLSETIGYDRLNLHRPGFDFVLEWGDGASGNVRRETLYRAYTPFYQPWEALSRNKIDYQWRSPQASCRGVVRESCASFQFRTAPSIWRLTAPRHRGLPWPSGTARWCSRSQPTDGSPFATARATCRRSEWRSGRSSAVAATPSCGPGISRRQPAGPTAQGVALAPAALRLSRNSFDQNDGDGFA